MAQHGTLDVSVEPEEVLLGCDSIAIRAQTPIDPESARSGIALQGARAAVDLSDDGRTATLTPLGALGPGRHVLRVEELVDPDGERLGEALEIPFYVSDSRAPLDASLRVESMLRLRVDELATTRLRGHACPDEPFVELFKATDRKTGEPVELAFDHEARPVDPAELFADLRRRREARYGKVHPALRDLLDQAGEDERVPVAVWLAVPGEELAAKEERGETREAPAAERKHAERIAEVAGGVVDLLCEHEAVAPERDPRAPVIFADVPARAVRRLQDDERVAAIFLHERRGVEDLKDSMAIAQSDTVQSTLSLTGKGVNVAVYEDGPDVTTNLVIADRFLSSPATSAHARHTHAIVKNVEPNRPHGHASGCNLFSANSMDLAAIRWAAQDRGCTVISQSFHRDSEQTDSGLSFDDMYKDWLVLHWPYPTILQAAGNGATSEFVNHKGFNSLTVANHNDTATALAGDSVFRNPASSHGDRELPEVGANGTAVTTVGLTLSGTSMAAPAAAGCTALLQEADGTLKSWPEGCRAILLAGASKNITGSTWWADRSAGVDAHDGTGAVDALESTRIARARSFRNAAPTRRGWDAGTLRSADIGAGGETTFAYQVTVPRLLLNPRVKVALAWDSVATIIDVLFFRFGFDVLPVDLDLKVYDAAGALVGYSGSWDNSYEIAEFAARPGETYTIRVRRWSGTADVWYGLAWTVQGTPLLRPDWDLGDRLNGIHGD